ncbi:MAG: Gldg family protein [Candidatus Poribacteria bacterium]|nr:Gldg family protein [Candidatus Poribacteria bacterium]
MPVEPSGLPDREPMKGANSPTSDKLGPLFGFFSLIFLFATLVILFLSNNRTSTVFWISLALGIAAFSVFAAKRFQTVLHFFVSRQARYGANVAISILATLGIAIILNVVVAQRFDKAADWTADKTFTLSDQTKNILHGLDREVKVIAFFSNTPNNPRSQQQYGLAKDMLERYKRETDKLTVEFVDPYADPLKKEEHGVRLDETTVFESSGERERVTAVDEQMYTSAIMKVVRDEIKKIYFLTGHEEQSIDDFEQGGYSQAKEELETQNYLVKTLVLTTEPQVPADCALLVIPGPKSPLALHEINAISKYLDNNGKLLVMFEPSITRSEDPNRNLVRLMDRWGIAVGNNLVVDLSRFDFIGGIAAPAVIRFEFHQIVRHMLKPVTFLSARSVTPKEGARPELNPKSLAKTTDAVGVSWGETARNEDGTFADAEYTPNEDAPPPVSLAAAVELMNDEEISVNEPKKTTTRIVAIGDADFASNFFFKSTGGGDLFLNAVNWLTLEEDLIAIRPKDPNQRTLRFLTRGEAAFIQIASIFLIPLIIFLVGLVVWWRRR